MLYHRRVITITAEDSPNVVLARRQMEAGIEPDGTEVVPGVLPWFEFLRREDTWDEVRKCIGLWGRFYKGAAILLFPPTWLNESNQRAAELRVEVPVRRAKGIGIDTGEGVANTSMSAVDEWGLIEVTSRLTPDTSVITGDAIAFWTKHNVAPERVCFDRGGGGKQAADLLKRQGFNVRTVGFGETLMLKPKRGLTRVEERLANIEERYTYKNRRAQMYHELSLLMDPSVNLEVNRLGHTVSRVFALPTSQMMSGRPEYDELRRQLAPMPKLTDEEGRYWMLPKNKKDPDSKVKTLIELLGKSPDEADSLVLAVHAMLHKAVVQRAGAL